MYICLRCTRRERLTVNRRAPGRSRRMQPWDFCSKRCLVRCSSEEASEITITASSSSKWAASSDEASGAPGVPARPPIPQARLDEGSLPPRSEEHTSELQSRLHLVCRLLLAK